MSDLTHINIPIELFVLPLKGRYEMSIVALAYNFGSKGLRLSNGKLAKAMKTSSRTIERVIARLRRIGIIEDAGTGKNDRCLRLTADTMSGVATGIMSGADTDTMSGEIPTSGVASTDMTADHNKELRENKGSNCSKGGFACGGGSASGFESFWAAYPRKVNRKGAQKAWQRLSPTQRLFDTIMAAVAKQEQLDSWLKDNGKFIPHASTWLNNARWEDEIAADPNGIETLETRDVSEAEAELLMEEVEYD